MDVQEDSVLEAMAEIGPASSEGATGFSSDVAAPNSLPTFSHRKPQPQGPASLPVQSISQAAAKISPKLPQHGHPKEIMIIPVEEKYLCGYCQLVLREPLQSDCGHRFCSCCRRLMSELPQPVSCPECAKEEDPTYLQLESMFEDKALIREMRKLQCKCVNPGCNWKGLFHEYISVHEKSCDKKMVICSLCGSQMSQVKLAHHQEFQCPKRQITCQYCGQQMLHEQKDKHMEICPQLPIKCDKCSAVVPRIEFMTHQERDCIGRDIVCPVPDCRKKMPKEMFPAHLNESPKMAQKHLLYLFDQVNRLEQELARLALPPAAAHREQPGTEAASEGMGARASDEHAQGAGQQMDNAAVGGAENAEPTVASTLKLHEDLMSVLHGEILRCIRQVEALTTGRTREARNLSDLQNKLQTVERNLGTVELRLQELQIKQGVGTLLESGPGEATWSIPHFGQVRRAAVNNLQAYVESPPFTTGSLGYKLRLRLYPDGDSEAKGEALSVYVQLLPGSFDDLLPWPFEADIHFMLVDRKDFKHHRRASIRSPVHEISCGRPVRDPRPGSSRGMGVVSLITLKEMGSDLSRYNVDDILYLRVLVDTQSAQLHARLRSLDPRQL